MIEALLCSTKKLKPYPKPPSPFAMLNFTSYATLDSARKRRYNNKHDTQRQQFPNRCSTSSLMGI